MEKKASFTVCNLLGKGAYLGESRPFMKRYINLSIYFMKGLKVSITRVAF